MKKLVPVVLVALGLGITGTTIVYARARNVSARQTAQAHHINLKVNSAVMVSTLSQFTGAGIEPNDGTKWEIINITVKNNGRIAQLNLPKLYTLESGRHTYKVAANKNNELNHKQFLRLLQPNTVTSGYIAFNIPRARGNFKLKFGTGRNTYNTFTSHSV